MNQHYCDIEELFVELSERTTKQKHALVEKLLTPDRAWSAKQLWSILGSSWGDLSTAHRNLNHLKEKGFLTVAANDDGETFYERVAEKHHDHLKCQKCGTLKCVPCPGLKQTHTLLFQGFCRKCS